MGIRQIVVATISEQLEKWKRERDNLNTQLSGLQNETAKLSARVGELNTLITEAAAELAAAQSRIHA
jgi:predicted  nucleic acid-binding Zn-ribbon protein